MSVGIIGSLSFKRSAACLHAWRLLWFYHLRYICYYIHTNSVYFQAYYLLKMSSLPIKLLKYVGMLTSIQLAN